MLFYFAVYRRHGSHFSLRCVDKQCFHFLAEGTGERAFGASWTKSGGDKGGALGVPSLDAYYGRGATSFLGMAGPLLRSSLRAKAKVQPDEQSHHILDENPAIYFIYSGVYIILIKVKIPTMVGKNKIEYIYIYIYSEPPPVWHVSSQKVIHLTQHAFLWYLVAFAIGLFLPWSPGGTGRRGISRKSGRSRGIGCQSHPGPRRAASPAPLRRVVLDGRTDNQRGREGGRRGGRKGRREEGREGGRGEGGDEGREGRGGRREGGREGEREGGREGGGQ